MTSVLRCRAYTLIEVLVAMTILAMSLTVLYRIFATGLMNVDLSSDYARAVLVAESLLAATGRDEVLRPGDTEGISSDRFHWSRTVEDYATTDQSELPVDAYRVTVSVEWQNRGRARRISIASIRLAGHGARSG